MDLQAVFRAETTRRAAFKWTGIGVGAAATSSAITACAAAAAPAVGTALEAVAPAVGGWLSDLILAVGGAVIADQIDALLDGSGSYSGYGSGASQASSDLSADGLTNVYTAIGKEPSTGVILFGCCGPNNPPAATDQLVMCAANGQAVALESWAWRALHAYATKAAGTGGDAQRAKMANYTAAELVLATAAGTVNSTDPTGSDRWVMYPTALGQIVYKQQTDASGKQQVTVTAIDLPQALGGTMGFSFALTDQAHA